MKETKKARFKEYEALLEQIDAMRDSRLPGEDWVVMYQGIREWQFPLEPRPNMYFRTKEDAGSYSDEENDRLDTLKFWVEEVKK